MLIYSPNVGVAPTLHSLQLQADYPAEPTGTTDGLGRKNMHPAKPKDLKWRIICKGVDSLIKQEGLKEEEVALWLDWQSIYQDNKEEKLNLRPN